VPYDEWWDTLVTGKSERATGLFVHPVADDRVMAGNGTIGLELLEQLDDFDAVVVPYGGGGLLTGIASAVKAERPEVRFYSAEPATGAPAAATFASGVPTEVEYTPSFVDGSGSKALIPRVWEHVAGLADGGFALPLDEVASAMRVLAERVRVIPEGAGALATAAALSGRVEAKRIVCIVSGGNIDAHVFARILQGETP
jgi:threonine dehydratase